MNRTRSRGGREADAPHGPGLMPAATVPPIFRAALKHAGLPVPVAEYRFHPTRKWRFDFAWPDALVALEVEGAVWVQGRHTRGSGFVKDMEKYNTAAGMGWRVLRVTPATLPTRTTTDLIRRALAA